VKDTISVSTTASVEQVFQIITDLEMIKKWEPSHRFPLVRHEWVPDTGILQKGNQLRVITPLWRFIARCVDIREYEVPCLVIILCWTGVNLNIKCHN